MLIPPTGAIDEHVQPVTTARGRLGRQQRGSKNLQHGYAEDGHREG